MAGAQQHRPKIIDETSAQEGSRWVGERPSAEAIAHWFSTIPLDEGMRHEDHIGGITIISAKETQMRLVNRTWTDVERMVHVPYPRVDARIAYFWKLCESHEDWRGVIEPVPVLRLREPGMFNENLPPGFAKMPVHLPDKRVVTYLTCTQQVRIFEGGGRFERCIRQAPPATKQVALVDRWAKADDNSLMKCETGAIGRALGMAGIFVIPGAGVATAEDMQEYLAGTGAAAGALEPQLPSDSEPEVDLDARINELTERLTAEQHAAWDAWMVERNFSQPLSELRESQKRGVLRKLEQILGG